MGDKIKIEGNFEIGFEVTINDQTISKADTIASAWQAVTSWQFNQSIEKSQKKGLRDFIMPVFAIFSRVEIVKSLDAFEARDAIKAGEGEAISEWKFVDDYQLGKYNLAEEADPVLVNEIFTGAIYHNGDDWTNTKV